MSDDRAFLVSHGFALRGGCVAGPTAQTMRIGGESTTEAGVYAFVIGKRVWYVGSALRGLKERLRHYEITQDTDHSKYTSARVRGMVLAKLKERAKVDVFTLAPPEHSWGELPVSLVRSIELALIRKFDPDWNKQGRVKSGSAMQFVADRAIAVRVPRVPRPSG